VDGSVTGKERSIAAAPVTTAKIAGSAVAGSSRDSAPPTSSPAASIGHPVRIVCIYDPEKQRPRV
jgi:hypothetical protein